ncbi:MAG: 2-phosphosulfolactate phosphatase [Bacteroidales bacterium]|nr:2-phosphosulfolactate phosphatase [Bacteroidales bacterium]
MKTEVLEFASGAKNAKGAVVIIDVFRAFSTACYAYDSGATRIIATGDPAKAFELRKIYHHPVLAGERNERKIEGFDFGNSPTEIIRSDLSGKIVILTTTAGTTGLMNASGGGVLLAAGLVNAGATAEYLRALDPKLVTLVAMGYRGTVSAGEDLLCAEIIRSRLMGENKDFSREISGLRHSAGMRFFEPANLDFSPPTDFFLCTMADRFNFVLKAEKRLDGNVDLARIPL